MKQFEIYLDVAVSGRVMAHLLDPPGLGLRYPSAAAMTAGLPGHIESHLEWLATHDEPMTIPAFVAFRIAEKFTVAGDFESGDDVGFYAPDAVPVSVSEIDRYLRIAGFAHQDLWRVTESLPDEILDRRIVDPKRSIREIVRHVVGAELWYMTRIIEDPAPRGMPEILREADERIDATDDVRERLSIVWETFQQFARGLGLDERSRVTTPSWYTERTAERWTTRKMLRRCVEHSREHTLSIERIIAVAEASAGG